MAVTAREVILVFRGQNYLSSAIRRVGRDMSMLSRTQQLGLQRQQLQVVGQRLRQSRATAQAELVSVQSGRQRLALDKAIAAQKLTQMRADASLLRNQTQLTKMNRTVRTRGTLPGYTAAETANILQAQRLKVEAAQGAIANQAVAVQQLDAREVQLAQREAQLTDIINTRSRAIGLNTVKLEQNAIAMRNLPWERFQQGARYVEHAGRVLQMFGLISTAVFGYFAKQAADFNTEITVAATQSTAQGQNTVKQTLANAKVLQDAVTQMMAEGHTIASRNDLSQAIYNIFSSITLPGGQKQQLAAGIQLLKEFNQVVTANAGLVDLGEVTKAGTLLINDFNIKVKDTPKALNTMQAAVRYGRMTMSEFLSTFNQAAPAAKSVGYNFTQMADDITFLSRKFGSLRMASTGYARLLEILQRNSEDFAAAGIKVKNSQTGALLPLDQIITQLIKKYPGLEKGTANISKIFKDITGTQGTYQARRALVFFLQDLEGYHKIAGLVNNDNNELSKSLRAAEQSTGVKWSEFLNQMRAIVLVVGEGAVRAFSNLGRYVKPVVDWFNNLSPHTKMLIGEFGVLVSVGTLLVGTLAALGGGLGSLLTGIILLLRYRREAKMMFEDLGGGGGGAAATGLAERAGGLALLKKATSRLGEEGGFVRPGPLGITAGAVSLVAFHKQIFDVVNALGGLNNTMNLANAGFVAFRAGKVINDFSGIAASATTAAGEINVVKAGLLGLEAMGPLAIAIMLDFIPRYKGNQDPRAPSNNPFQKFLSGLPVFGGLASRVGQAADFIIGNTVGFGGPGEATPAQVQKNVNTLRRSMRQANIAVMMPEIRKLRKAFREGFPDPAKEHARVLKAQQTLMQQISNVTALYSKAQTSNSLDDWTAYYKALDKLQKKYKGSRLEAINEILNSEKSALGSSTAINTQTFQDVVNGVKGIAQTYLSQEQAIAGGLFQGPFMQSPFFQNMMQWGHRINGGDLFKDLRSQIHMTRAFGATVQHLRRAGAPQQLIDDILQAGPSAYKQVGALGHMPRAELQQYFRLYREEQDLQQQAALRDLNARLKYYRTFGRNVALAIVTGLQDENVRLQKALENTVRQMFPGLPVGATGAGGKPTHRRASINPNASNHTTNNIDVKVTAPKDSDVSTQLKHADFALRQKYNKFHHR